MRLEDRSPMSIFARSRNHGRTFIATCVFAAFVWALALSVSPQLHQRIHSDATRAEHSCAVTAVTTGSYEHASHPSLVSALHPVAEFGQTAVLHSVWVQPMFLCAHIFAHAPPACS
jgi:protein-S-isoprenylcysteine O-methyltransferase Ste14